jgi:hypothetical protein
MAVCALAVWRGRDDERLAAAGFLAAWALSLVVFKSRSEETQWAVLAIDFGLLALVTWIALHSRRYWPLLAAALQALAVGAPLAKALDAGVTGWAYLTAALAFQYLALITIGYGAATAPRRYAEIDAAEAPNDVPGATRR